MIALSLTPGGLTPLPVTVALALIPGLIGSLAAAASPPAAVDAGDTRAPVAATLVPVAAAAQMKTVAETLAAAVSAPAADPAAVAAPLLAANAIAASSTYAVATSAPVVAALGAEPVSLLLAAAGAIPSEVHQAVGVHLGRDDLRRGMVVLPSEASEPEWESSRFRRSPVKGALSRGPNCSSR